MNMYYILIMNNSEYILYINSEYILYINKEYIYMFDIYIFEKDFKMEKMCYLEEKKTYCIFL